jgi:DNA-binding MarR family transcriptional regulator
LTGISSEVNDWLMEAFMETMTGTLHLDFLPNRAIQLLFTARDKGTKSRPLGISNTGQALSDLISTWGFSSAKAQATIDELEKVGHVEREVTVETANVAALFE